MLDITARKGIPLLLLYYLLPGIYTRTELAAPKRGAISFPIYGVNILYFQIFILTS